MSKMKQKQKSEIVRTRRSLFTYVLIGLIVFLGLVCFYNGSLFAPRLPRANDVVEDGSDPVTGRFVSKRVDFDELPEDQERNPEVPKSIPVRLKLVLLFNYFKYRTFLFVKLSFFVL